MGNIFCTKRNICFFKFILDPEQLGSGIIFSPIRIWIRILLKFLIRPDPVPDQEIHNIATDYVFLPGIQFLTSPFRKINLLFIVFLIHQLSTSECRKRELILLCSESTNFCLSKTGHRIGNSRVLFNNFFCKFDHFSYHRNNKQTWLTQIL
jgi:hypothetical protein